MPARTLLLLIVAIFATVFCAWRIFWVGPEKACLAHQGQWRAATRTCERPKAVLTAVPAP